MTDAHELVGKIAELLMTPPRHALREKTYGEQLDAADDAATLIEAAFADVRRKAVLAFLAAPPTDAEVKAMVARRRGYVPPKINLYAFDYTSARDDLIAARAEMAKTVKGQTDG